MLIMNNFQRLADQSLTISSRAHIVSSWNRTARCLQLLSFIVGNDTELYNNVCRTIALLDAKVSVDNAERVLELIKLLIKRILK